MSTKEKKKNHMLIGVPKMTPSNADERLNYLQGWTHDFRPVIPISSGTMNKGQFPGKEEDRGRLNLVSEPLLNC